MATALAGQVVFAELPSSWALLLKSTSPPVTEPEEKLNTPTAPNAPPQFVPPLHEVFCADETPKAKLPVTCEVLKAEEVCLRIMPDVNGPVVSKPITCPVEATPPVI